VAWRDSPEPFRQYTLTYRKEPWDAAKTHATGVTKALKKATAPIPVKPVAVK
jgi:hypothetical protein